MFALLCVVLGFQTVALYAAIRQPGIQHTFFWVVPRPVELWEVATVALLAAISNELTPIERQVSSTLFWIVCIQMCIVWTARRQ